MELIFPGLDLARRLEASDADNARASSAEALDIAGGVAAFAGPTSPLTHAIGIGMNGPVTESDLDRLEDYYRTRGAPSNIDLCPLADPTLAERLGRRGYRITEFNNVLYLRVAPDAAAAGVVETNDADLWIRTVMAGFLEREELTQEEHIMGGYLTRMPGIALFLAEADGVPAAGGAARMQGTRLGNSRKPDSLPAAKSVESPVGLAPPESAFALLGNSRKTDSLAAAESVEPVVDLAPPESAFALLGNSRKTDSLAAAESVEPVAGLAPPESAFALLTMFADSTLARFRGRALHKILIEQRIAWGAAQGAEMATAATLPGTTSQRNYMRAGFRVAYTKINMCREL